MTSASSHTSSFSSKTSSYLQVLLVINILLVFRLSGIFAAVIKFLFVNLQILNFVRHSSLSAVSTCLKVGGADSNLNHQHLATIIRNYIWIIKNLYYLWSVGHWRPKFWKYHPWNLCQNLLLRVGNLHHARRGLSLGSVVLTLLVPVLGLASITNVCLIYVAGSSCWIMLAAFLHSPNLPWNTTLNQLLLIIMESP